MVYRGYDVFLHVFLVLFQVVILHIDSEPLYEPGRFSFRWSQDILTS